MAAARSLPGIRIDTAPAPAAALPRMDVAVFAGFASTGPLHRPVAVESVAQYAAVFGADAPLAWDAARGEILRACLGPAVRAFFSNGGRRCWVLRVARSLPAAGEQRDLAWTGDWPAGPYAEANRFALAGVLRIAADGTVAAAQAQSRAAGSWSDGATVATALRSQGMGLSASRAQGRSLGFSTTATLAPGDLLEFADPLVAGQRLFAAVNTVAPRIGAAAGLTNDVGATLCAAFDTLDATLSPTPAAIDGLAFLQGSTPVTATLAPATDAPARWTLRFAADPSAHSAIGQWLRWTDGGQTVWIRIDTFAAADGSATLAEGPAWRETAPSWPQPAPARGAVLRLDVRVTSTDGLASHLAGAGLSPAHANAWWRQVSDDIYHATLPDPTQPRNAEPAPAQGPRFPLAALDEEWSAGAPLAFIPLGVTPLFGAALTPWASGATALERDGLVPFDAGLFLDPDLASLHSTSIPGAADAIRYLDTPARDLFGVHAALSIASGASFNEASLIAVPDAVHPGWQRRAWTEPTPAAPKPEAAPAHWFTHRGDCAAPVTDKLLAARTEPDFGAFLDRGTRLLTAPWLKVDGPARISRGGLQLAWSASEAGADYLVELAQDPTFRDARLVYRGATLRQVLQFDREGIFHLRVTALADDERSAPSNIVTVQVADAAWVVAPENDYADAGAAQLLQVQRALLRLAASSGELLAVLSLPRHYQAVAAAAHARKLRTLLGASALRGDADGADALAFDEAGALSYGALYHPWAAHGPVTGNAVSTAAVGDGLRACPPEGTVCGVMADRARLRGAWIAPANQAFKDVVALTPIIAGEAWPDLQDAQVNLLRDDPRGFLALAADTLSNDLDWRPLNVRRLLMLLRRLALQRGSSYVFEPNGDVLRRSVQRGFSLLLDDLFRRGAFAGDSQVESFRVVTDGRLNTDQDRDAGRFIVELRVAPALPMQFLTLRLLQSGERLSVSEEI